MFGSSSTDSWILLSAILSKFASVEIVFFKHQSCFSKLNIIKNYLSLSFGEETSLSNVGTSFHWKGLKWKDLATVARAGQPSFSLSLYLRLLVWPPMWSLQHSSLRIVPPLTQQPRVVQTVCSKPPRVEMQDFLWLSFRNSRTSILPHSKGTAGHQGQHRCKRTGSLDSTFQREE